MTVHQLPNFHSPGPSLKMSRGWSPSLQYRDFGWGTFPNLKLLPQNNRLGVQTPGILPRILPSETKAETKTESPLRDRVRKGLASYPAFYSRSPWCLILSPSLLLDIQYILISLMLDSYVRVGFCCVDEHKCALLALPEVKCFLGFLSFDCVRV